jgi:hypothetical protein
MLLVLQCNCLNIGSNEIRPKEGFYAFFRRGAVFKAAVMISASIVLMMSAGLTFAQAGSAPQGRNQARPNSTSPQPAKPSESKRMEQEERRRLRQEIQRHGPDFRSKEATPLTTPKTVAAPVSTPITPLSPAPAVAAPVTVNPPQPPSLPPLPSYFGWPVVPPSSPSANTSVNPNFGNARSPALSQEERQQLRQQIREERKRGQYATPTEAER